MKKWVNLLSNNIARIAKHLSSDTPEGVRSDPLDEAEVVLGVGRDVEVVLEQLQLLRLEAFDEAPHAEPDHRRSTVALDGSLSVFNPAHGREIGGLRTVETRVEAGMICVRETDDEISRTLLDLWIINVNKVIIIIIIIIIIQPVHVECSTFSNRRRRPRGYLFK